MPDQESAEATTETGAPGTSRRGMLRGAAGIGAAGLAAGVFAGAVAGPASAATAKPAADEASAAHKEPLVVHVHDARTGVIDLYTGEQHVRVTDHDLAARLARAAG
jgi:anti-sigma factor RsiW